MQELEFKVVVDKDLGRKVEGVVAFGDFVTEDSTGRTAIYQVNEVSEFFRDLILGRPLPLVFVTRDLENLSVILGVTLFLHRDLAIQPIVPSLLTSFGLADAYGVPGQAHVDRDLSRFLKFLRVYVGSAKGKKGQQEALTSAVSWIRAYILEGSLPALPTEPDPPRIIEQGTDGFVFATTKGNLSAGWEELYRQGFLRGVLLTQNADRWKVLAARKSAFLALDLTKAADALNEAEAAMGEPSDWVTDGIWLLSPENGTLIPPSTILQVFLRV